MDLATIANVAGPLAFVMFLTQMSKKYLKDTKAQFIVPLLPLAFGLLWFLVLKPSEAGALEGVRNSIQLWVEAIGLYHVGGETVGKAADKVSKKE